MKIKIVYGVDMRLWRYNLAQDKPDPSSYQHLLTHICKTFEFDNIHQFRVAFNDDDDTRTTICCAEDFADAYFLAAKAEKKSLKLYITDNSPQKHSENDRMDEKEAIQSTINLKPSEEEINAFLNDSSMMDLLSDLFVSVFEALKAANFEVSFVECLQGIVLSSNDKYKGITSSPIWRYFTEDLLPKYAPKIEGFIVPMIQMNGGIDSQMIKQWIPTLIQMVKVHQQNGMNCGLNGMNFALNGMNPWFGGCGYEGRRHWRGRRGRGRGKGWRGHKGWKGHKGRRGGWKGHKAPWHHPHPHHEHPHQHHHPHQYYPQYNGGHHGHGYEGYVPSAPPNNVEVFAYTEELVAIMNMGFANMGNIKELLNQHKGNKEVVVQALVSNKYKE